MLHEISSISSPGHSGVKRWFSCRGMDLYVMLYKNVPFRFQLTYNKRGLEKTISWDGYRGFHYKLADNGETSFPHDRQTAVLTGAGEQNNMAVIARDFLAACKKIDVGLADFIYARLMEYPIIPAKHSALHTDPAVK